MDHSISYDEQLVLTRIAEGDENAFRQLFSHWHQYLAGYILKITESRELTEEIVQDVFLKIWMIRESLAEVREFKSFLFVVSRNHAFQTLKKLSRERKLQKMWKSETLNSTGDEPLHAEWQSVIDEAIDSLPPRRREAWLLVRHEQLSYQEAAERLGISRESIKTHLQLAAQSIIDYIKSHSDKGILILSVLLKIL